MSLIIYVTIGFVIGSFCGIFVAALCSANKSADEYFAERNDRDNV